MKLTVLLCILCGISLSAINNIDPVFVTGFENGIFMRHDPALIQDYGCATASSEVEFIEKFKAAMSPIKMVTAMWNHGPAMVATQRSLELEVPKFFGSEIADILAYLKGTATSAGERADFLRPGEPDRGRVVFVAKECVRCHAVNGGDERTGPDLAEVDLGKSVTEIAGILWLAACLMLWFAIAFVPLRLLGYRFGRCHSTATEPPATDAAEECPSQDQPDLAD